MQRNVLEERPPKTLIWVTIAIFVLIMGMMLSLFGEKLPEAITISTKGQPTIGYPKAPVQVVVFKEPKCINCKEFNDNIYPKIKEDFIDTNKVKYTVIPVSFLPGSMPAATSLLCVYYADPLYPNNELFFTYLDYMYDHQPPEHLDWATLDKLTQMAHSASPAINTQKLRKCIERETYRVKIEQNNSYGRKIMGGTLSTPTVYVNGILVKELSYSAIQKLINELLEQKGVN